MVFKKKEVPVKIEEVKICGKCHLIIEESESYAKLEFYELGKLKHKGYLHKTCNDNINQENKQKQEMMNKIMGLASRVEGMLPPQEVNFQIK